MNYQAQDKFRAGLRAGIAPAALLLAMMATPAFAQTAPAPAQTPVATDDTDAKDDVVVTGTLFKGADPITPLTTVTAADLDRRGLVTTQDAIQQLSSNGGPALTNNFTANGAFAAGASAVSLRGLSVNSTLVLFDGLRAAYYPLADDGSRNFVDLNTIPDDIVDRIEVVRDGASSTYGADAIAGVVNIITKKEFRGIQARGSAGVSQRGSGAEYRASLTAGFGDLKSQGFNAYISGFYYQSTAVKNSEVDFPYNTDDHRGLILGGQADVNSTVNGRDANGLLQPVSLTAGSFSVRPYDATNTTPQGNSQLLNPTCAAGTLTTVTAADRAVAGNATVPNAVCNVDYTNTYGNISPNIQRFGVSARATARVNDSIEVYAEANFVQNKSSYNAFPAVAIGVAPTGIFFPQFATSSNAANRAAGSVILALPVFVCPERINCATSANRRLNPNNPFAAQGFVARVNGRDLSQVTYNENTNRTYRIALGANGNITDNISFNFGATAMHVDLRRLTDGYVRIQQLLDVVADGTYNFVNPGATPQAVQDYLTPVNITNATSDQYQVEGSFQGSFFDLPGGKVKAAVGGSIRYEAVDSPSANSDVNGPTQRYFTLNAFGTKGNRTVYSAFGEVKLPILRILEVNASGRYDSYSSGQSAFSPKVAALFTPFRQLNIRGSWSRGFRIPAFAEANALPTTGFVSNNVSLFNNAYLAAYNCTTATFNTCPTYIRTGSYGQTTLASPNLQPEKSRSFNAGFDFTPIKNVTISLDYYNIRKTGVITQPSNAPALTAYYNNQPIPAGYTVIADAPEPNFPNARPRVAFVQSQLVNATSYQTDGLDLTVSTKFDIFGFTWRSVFDANYILKLEQVFADGTRERYDGTLGNFNLTSGNGTSKLRGSWQNSFDFGKDLTVTGTANYYGGYNLSAQDQGTGYNDCGLSPFPNYCNVSAYVTFDLNAQVKIADRFTLGITALNLFDAKPPIDPVTYGAHYYNAVQGGGSGGAGILGRYFKVNVTTKF
ncbi:MULTISPECIES: TonB-dependent receptor domain-containing protein [Sphingomonas]|uniref:TonB-dependent receptor domain-containing protein n=1 Tax=Sphingomonas TaxID=13687 RepID=UPI00083471BD|nr:TonB-dependent receptor [Sphingomonas sp. CCH10-B3]